LRFHSDALSPCFIGAEALQVDAATVRNCVAAISRVFVDSSKNHLGEKELIASIAAAELPAESVAALYAAYKHARAELRERAKQGSTQLPSYQGFDWRLDVEMSRRGAHHIAQPVYMLRFDCVTPSAATSAGGESAATSAVAADSSKSIYLQSDYANLTQLHSALQDALAESTTQHASRVERYIR
jgi:hypothetical protein